MPCTTLISFFFFFNDTATTEIYTLSLHDALPISHPDGEPIEEGIPLTSHGSTWICPAALNPVLALLIGTFGLLWWNAERSEEHTSELQSQSNLVCRLLLEKKKEQLRKRR